VRVKTDGNVPGPPVRSAYEITPAQKHRQYGIPPEFHRRLDPSEPLGKADKARPGHIRVKTANDVKQMLMQPR